MTAMIASGFSHARYLMKNVRRWRDAAYMQQWTATALLEAERRFNRIHGDKRIQERSAALTKHVQR